MESTEKRIKAVIADGPVGRAPDPYGRKTPSYAVRVTYSLEDGRTLPGTIHRERKRDVLPALEEANRKAGQGAMHAVLHDGRFVMTSTTYGLLAGGLR